MFTRKKPFYWREKNELCAGINKTETFLSDNTGVFSAPEQALVVTASHDTGTVKITGSRHCPGGILNFQIKKLKQE